MSDEMNHGRSGQEAGFEREDLSSRGIFFFMIGLAIVGVAIYFIIIGMYSFLDNMSARRWPPPVRCLLRTGRCRACHAEYMEQRFKENGVPMLEVNERGQFRDFLLNQENQLNSYGWIDKDAGVAHIPIERAMDLIVQRGLPVYPQSSANASAAASKAPLRNRQQQSSSAWPLKRACAFEAITVSLKRYPDTNPRYR